mmetsp:Transcript_45551/g.102238  ORF Transcript_45551/g.102238 Transcript_45551/m.102238 type:complete len:130 (-) Transcript_45551:215-604(-)
MHNQDRRPLIRSGRRPTQCSLQLHMPTMHLARLMGSFTSFSNTNSTRPTMHPKPGQQHLMGKSTIHTRRKASDTIRLSKISGMPMIKRIHLTGPQPDPPPFSSPILCRLLCVTTGCTVCQSTAAQLEPW